MSIDRKWFSEQVKEFAEVEQRKYATYAEVLEELFEHAKGRIAPQAIVQVRAKSVPSFAEKILRKQHKYLDPIRQLTDLCGARVIVHTKAEVERICTFIRTHFDIDEENSLDSASLLRASEFGYRSVHYILRFRPGQYPSEAIPVEVPQDVIGLKAEVQVRTIAQHCWADIGHDRIYKSSFKVPDKWVRQSALAAALLEDVDETFARLVQGLGAFQTSHGAYLDEQRIKEEIEILETVRACGDPDYRLAYQIARLATSLADWDKIVTLLDGCQRLNSAPLLLCYGFATCQRHKGDRGGAGYQAGRGSLEQAVEAAPRDVEALATLADTWLGIDEHRVMSYYEKAFRLEPFHPRTLAGYVIGLMVKERNTAFLSAIRPGLEVAIGTCYEQAQVGVHLPWAYYHAGALSLFLGQPYESLAAYAKAVKLSSAEFMIDAALDSLARLDEVKTSVPELEWVRRVLLLAKAVKFRNGELDPYLKSLASTTGKKLEDPVVIVAGGCNPALQHQLEAYRPVLHEAFQEFHGTLISGGTKEGISGLVGEVAAANRPRIRALGYIPESMPWDAHSDGERYELRVTEGTTFTPLQPLQSWIDLVASGVQPSRVKLLGINGGPIAAFEYRLALVLGAEVGVVDDSGREADKLIADSEWKTVKNLAQLFRDTLTIRNFTESHREALARRIHEEYLSQSRADLAKVKPTLADWENLSEDSKEANRRQADDIEPKLREAGIKVYVVNDRDIHLLEFTAEEIEFLAKREHERWCKERLEKGWKPGTPRDDANKIHPDLVAWEKLPETSKQKDRNAVRAIPNLLQELGLELRPHPTEVAPPAEAPPRKTRRSKRSK